MAYCELLCAYRARYVGQLREAEFSTPESFTEGLRANVCRYNLCPYTNSAPHATLEIRTGEACTSGMTQIYHIYQINQVLETSSMDYRFRNRLNGDGQAATDIYYDSSLASFYFGVLRWETGSFPPAIQCTWTLLPCETYEALARSNLARTMGEIDCRLNALGDHEWTAVCTRHAIKISLECDIAMAGIKESLSDHLLPELLPIVFGFVAPSAVVKTSFWRK